MLSRSDLTLQKIEIEEQLKALTVEQSAELHEIYEAIKSGYTLKNGIVPFTMYLKFKAEFAKKSTHILSSADRKIFMEHKRLVNQFAKLNTQEIEYERLRYVLETFEDKILYFLIFIDFRGRVYSSGWPLGFNTVFKPFLMSPSKNVLKIPKQVSFLKALKRKWD